MKTKHYKEDVHIHVVWLINM